MTKNLTLERIIAVVGTQQKLGEMLGVTQPAVASWLSEGEVPYDKAWILHVVFDVALKHLCPTHLKHEETISDRAIEMRSQYQHLRRKYKSDCADQDAATAA